MGFGGSDFGFFNGANTFGDDSKFVLQPQVQSYDYNAPISETGTHNLGSDGIDKFVAIQKVFVKHGANPTSEPVSLKKKAFIFVYFLNLASKSCCCA